MDCKEKYINNVTVKSDSLGRLKRRVSRSSCGFIRDVLSTDFLNLLEAM